jgi:hypothetical protein
VAPALIIKSGKWIIRNWRFSQVAVVRYRPDFAIHPPIPACSRADFPPSFPTCEPAPWSTDNCGPNSQSSLLCRSAHCWFDLGRGPSRLRPCQASKLSPINVTREATVHTSARANIPINHPSTADALMLPTKSTSAAPHVDAPPTAPRTTDASSIMVRRTNRLRWARRLCSSPASRLPLRRPFKCVI